ncbi:LolA family protein [Desulfurivibrio alkaliphilus]|uniref:Outer membrane lipoprotein carrier protein LolA n=1 Tax=Desulfurivibrio alkaliphilus (strain DSM 19089 / UNIQEM U267 / AHT2) TaxID=589865 RepID=D6Z2P1_DESAT|nr:outer membrane lipoprotein carrier protein LolA [Desulfurivibrio alkaliphilus]ADH85816.1 outer membrane lipoprotein carrier protein LolA [Desulfurivibrio alkaliphilus AHT 2]
MGVRWLVKLTGLLLILLLPINGAAGEKQEELAAFLQKIDRSAAEMRSMSCAFTQEKELAMFDRPVVFRGRLDLVRPDRLRWEFASPINSVLIFKGDSGMRCDGNSPPVRFDLQQDPIMRMVARQLWLWLGGEHERLAAEYHLSLAADATLLIEPKDPAVAEFVSSLTIAFNPETHQPRQVEIKEAGGDLTRLTFHDCQPDPDLDDALFSRCHDGG